MVRCATGIYCVECFLCRGFEACIVIQNTWLIGVNVPIGGTSDLVCKAGICQCMIKITSLTIKSIRICVRAVVIEDQIGEVVACSSRII